MSKRIATQTKNALRVAGVTDPYACTLQELLRVRGVGPLGVAYLAKKGYPPTGSGYLESKGK